MRVRAGAHRRRKQQGAGTGARDRRSRAGGRRTRSRRRPLREARPRGTGRLAWAAQGVRGGCARRPEAAGRRSPLLAVMGEIGATAEAADGGDGWDGVLRSPADVVESMGFP
ncbi:Os10g0483200 [Oryza sativa Japonica Group]|uniref:Os10g0483200 protein n=1 Tax=Oryza sativa subsp. japonica TaxID=39947 RepID=A0A0P0XVG8_ORYSJ|nr:hypothetical protein DAI22_10g135800 [Oryza sativa Japonica Group]BAT11357.1 Os10g0483200 [Oryza sativa Japonica Group]